MSWPPVFAGQRLTAQMLTDMQWQHVTQDIAQSVTSSTTLVDSNLILPALAAAEYLFELRISYTAAVAGDLRCAWTVPTNGFVDGFTAGVGSGNTFGGGTPDSVTAAAFRRPGTATVRIVGGADAGSLSYFESGRIYGGDGGNVTWQFAQGTSSVTATQVTASSRLEWIRIA